MSTLVNRLIFGSDRSSRVEEPEKNPRHELLSSVMQLGTSTQAFDDLCLETSSFEFPSNPFDANISLAHLYLELEHHLVIKDPRFIGKPLDLRNTLKKDFRELVDSAPFALLYENEKNQEVLLSRLFVVYLLQTLSFEKPDDRLSLVWLGLIKRKFVVKPNLNIVERVNLLRRLKERTQEIYDEIAQTYGLDFAEKFFYSCYDEFKDYYLRLPGVEAVVDIIPQRPEEETKAPVRKLVPVDTGDSLLRDHGVSSIPDTSLLENILDGFVLITRQGTVLQFNQRAEKLLGLIPNDSIYNCLPSSLSQDLQDDLEKSDLAIPNKVVGKRTETTLPGIHGENQDYEVSITNNYTESQDTFTLFIRNISDKKHMLEAIRNAKIHAERTATAKATFLSNMSHEIRTPLNVILGLSEIISKGEQTDPNVLRKNLKGIDFSARNLLSIVNDILDFSKIEAGKLTLQSIDFNLRKVVETLTDGFKIKANEKGLELTTTIHSKVPDLVIGDQYRLNQVLTNLIGNAIKFTERGKVDVNVALLKASKKSITLQFRVSDTGIGISEKDQKKIFDGFYQAKDNEQTEVSGTGLGLTITRELIDLQDGTFRLTSRQGEGSVFEFDLPFKPSSLKSLNDSIKTHVHKDKKLAGLKVLVAEDNEMNQFYITQLLKNLNVTVDLAENGKEAVRMYTDGKEEYDLILMDMHMPVMGGIEAITQIRKSNRNSLKKVPIVACSADVFPEARKKAIKAGIDFYLTKPLSEDAVKEVLFWLISEEDTNTAPVIRTKESNISKPDQSHIDIHSLKDTFDNDNDFIRSLLEIFVQTTPEDYKSLRQCIDKGYFTRASSLAHKMKSSFMNLGLTVHGHHLQLIEKNIGLKDGIEEAKKHLSAFGQIYTRALLEANKLLLQLKSEA